MAQYEMRVMKMNEELKNQIKKLKKERDAVILAHYYVDGEVQELADYVGDSYFLAKKATEIPAGVIIFCGVSFMGESAKILNPEKKVVMADRYADCPMAHMIEEERIREVREQYPDALVLAHPECTEDVLEEADFIGSTSQIIDYATASEEKEFIICTEMGIFYELHMKNPQKKFYSVGHRQFCPNMKRISLESVLHALETLDPEVELDEEMRQRAKLPLQRMLELAQ